MATFAQLNQTALQFTKSGSLFATIGTDAAPDTLTLLAAGGVGDLFLQGIKTPTAGTHAANKAYVDSVAQGLDIKPSVRCATSANVDLATALASGEVVDDITLATGDRVLVKHQTEQKENGIYVVNAVGAPSRAADLAAGSRAAGAFVFVESGTVLQDSGFVCTTDSDADTVGDNVGGDTLQWTAFSGAGAFTAGVGLTKTGTLFDVNGDFGTINVSTTGNLALSTDKFVVTGASGDVSVNTDKFTIAGASGDVSVNAGTFTIAGASGNTVVGGTLGVTGAATMSATCNVVGDMSVNSTKFTVAAATGNTVVAGTFNATGTATLDSACIVAGDLSVNTDKLTVAAATGNTVIAGTAAIANDLSVNTDKFTVTAASGNTTVAGTFSAGGAATLSSTCSVVGDMSVNTDKFTVVAASGNTSVGGTLQATGAATLSSTCDVLGDFNVGGDSKFDVASSTGNTTIGDAFSVEAATGNCSANSFISTSDGTLKQDIVSIPAEQALETVMNMRAVTFAFIAKPDDPRVGVIAQEMRVAAPALVKDVESNNREAHLAVNYGDLTGYLIGAVQALQHEVQALKQQLAPA
jgi:hypothetical protein